MSEKNEYIKTFILGFGLGALFGFQIALVLVTLLLYGIG